MQSISEAARRHASPAALLCLAALVLAGCVDPFAPEEPLPCPYVRVFSEGETYTRYRVDAQPTPENVELTAKVLGQEHSVCDYDEEDGVLTRARMDLNVLFGGQRGPAGTSEPVERVPYFVALVRPDRSIAWKQPFVAELTFAPGETFAQEKLEEITIEIPLNENISAWEYQVIVSFQLSLDQLELKRRLKN